MNKPGTSQLLMRFLSVPEGIQYLEKLGWVENMLRKWKEEGQTTTYATSINAIWKVSLPMKIVPLRIESFSDQNQNKCVVFELPVVTV